jgi:hypothetical protein
MRDRKRVGAVVGSREETWVSCNLLNWVTPSNSMMTALGERITATSLQTRGGLRNEKHTRQATLITVYAPFAEELT